MNDIWRSKLNYQHLLYFWAIAHEGGLTKAASRLHISPSALSVQLAKLEAQLGHPLFDRQGRRLLLTEAGRIALDHADTMFAAGNELLSSLKGQPGARRQVLRVGALTTLSRNFQFEFLRTLIGRADTELVLCSGAMHSLLAQLEAHVLDVVLTNIALRRDAHSGLRSHLLDQQPVSLVGRRRKKRSPFHFPDDLRTQPIVLPSLDSGIRVEFDHALALAGIRPIIVAEVDDMAMLRLIARESDALTLVPPIVVRDELSSGVLIEHCRLPTITESFYAIVPSRRFPNPLLTEVLASSRSGREVRSTSRAAPAGRAARQADALGSRPPARVDRRRRAENES